jgi:hypothetical protein
MSTNAQELQDILSQPLNEVPTEIPLINGTAELTLSDVKVETNKKQDGSNLNMTFSLTTPMQSVDGKSVAPGAYGSKIFHTIALKKTEKYNPAEKLARLKMALTGSKEGSFGAPEQYIGATVMAVLKPEMSEQSGNRTVISRFVKKG